MLKQGQDLRGVWVGKGVVRVRKGGGPDQEMQGSGRVRGGGQGGSTKLSGTFKGDMHEVPGYPLHEERGRLGFGPRSGHDAPQGPTSHPRGVSG